jgi:Tfp pilus assembly major pilin PilA
MFYKKQKGTFFAEIVASVGIISVLSMSALSFYNHAIANAQVATGLKAAKAVMSQVQTRFAHAALPCETDNSATAGITRYSGSDHHSYVDNVTWHPNCLDGTRQGHLSITFKADETVNKILSGKNVVFFFEQSTAGGSLLYKSCLTDIGGANPANDNKLPENDSASTHLITCEYVQELDPETAVARTADDI